MTTTQITDTLNGMTAGEITTVAGQAVKAVAGRRGIEFSIGGKAAVKVAKAISLLAPVTEAVTPETGDDVVTGRWEANKQTISAAPAFDIALARQQQEEADAQIAAFAAGMASEADRAAGDAEMYPADAPAEPTVTEPVTVDAPTAAPMTDEDGLGAVDIAAEEAQAYAEAMALKGLPDGGAAITEPALLCDGRYTVMTLALLKAATAAAEPIAVMVRIGKHFTPGLLLGMETRHDAAIDAECTFAQVELAQAHDGKGKVNGTLAEHKITRRTIALATPVAEALKAAIAKPEKVTTVKAGKAGAEVSKATGAVKAKRDRLAETARDLAAARAELALLRSSITQNAIDIKAAATDYTMPLQYAAAC